MKLDNNIRAFFALVKAGLWENEVKLSQYEMIDYKDIYRLSEEQSVVGLVTAGLEHVVDVKVPKEDVLQFIGQSLLIEQRNSAMNSFIGCLVNNMRREDIYTILVKGQGAAQCYERPNWRTAGDIDFYLSKSNYEKAKSFLLPKSLQVEPEDKKRLHLGMSIDSWIVELHGTLHTGISNKMNVISDEIHRDIFYNGNVRSWNNNGVTVFLPSADNDVIVIFNHYITHFYGEGIGLRQICDWCRLLWIYKSEINVILLEKRLKRMRLMREWKAFGSFAVEYLGMPVDAMPFYEKNKRAKQIAELIIETGSFGNNKDNSYRKKGTQWQGYFKTLFRRLAEFGRIARIFPYNAPCFFMTYVINRAKVIL